MLILYIFFVCTLTHKLCEQLEPYNYAFDLGYYYENFEDNCNSEQYFDNDFISKSHHVYNISDHIIILIIFLLLFLIWAGIVIKYLKN